MVALDNSGTDYQDTCKSSVKNDEDNNVKPRDAYQPNGKGKAIDKKPNDSLNQHADMNKLKEKGDMLFELKRFEEAIECYIKLEDLIAQNIHVYFKIGDCLTALKNNEASKWYNKGLNWQPNDSNVAVIYSLLWTATPQTRPASIQLDLIRRIIPFKPISYIYEELEILGKNFEQYFPITNDNMYNTESIYSLISLLYHLPEAHQGQALSVLTQQQTQRIASLLIQLQSAKLVGLTPLTTNIVRSWNHCQDNIKTATNFWKTFQHYEVSQQDADLFKARHNMLRKKYSVAEPLLQRIIEHHPSETEAIWSLIEIQSYLHNPLHTQYKLSLELLYYEKNNVERRFEAMRILDNILTKEKNCLTVTQWIAEMQVGIHDTPLIQEYRKGNWDSIPTLRNHSDYVFPTVIVIDIENDYQPTATPGSCLIEVGAVRIKGNTELATYNAVIQRNFIAQKVANRQAEARDVQVVANELSNFINETYDPQGPVILVGHNLATVDAIHLRAIGIDIRDEQIIDTLAFARLLYPDRLRHNLKEMCDLHHINLDEAHNALPDAQANAHLLYALGEEVVNNRSHLLPGFRAFVREGSAFDRAILQPRRVVVDPTCDWQLTPTPSPMTSRVYKKTITSSELSIDLQQTQDCIVEYTHSSATYMNMLPSTRTILITVGSRARIEHLVANEQDNQECYILPNIYTLLCAKRLQQKIIEEPRPEIQLQLYCLYQASHNHDARTLYPFRLPLTSLVNQTKEDQDLRYIKDILSSTYCTHHTNQQCETWKQTKQAIVQKRIILATHEIFLNYKLPKRDTIIIDDLDELQMHIGEYEAQKFLSENLRQDHPTLFTILNDAITMYCTPEPGQEPGQKRIHTRIPLSYVAPLFISIDGEQETGLLTKIREQGKIGQRYAKYLEIWCRKAYEEQKVSERVQAQWLDVYYSDTDTPNNTKIESWSFCSIDANIPEVFHTKFWNPYTQHILCGHALFQGTTQVQSKSLNMTFLERFFDLPKNLPRRQHQTTHTRSALYIPDDKQIQPASFLAHYAWIESVGDFLYQNIAISQRSFVITLHEQRLLHALVNTFKEVKMVQSLPQHIISTKQGYHLRKISEILSDHNQSTITFLSPSQRKYMADIPADIEASGPLRFINQRDPLVVAQLRSFKARFPKEQPFTSYILPQAILELKARISTPSKLHIILDSSLHSTIYYEEVQAVLKDICDFVELPVTSQQGPQKEQFKNIYAKQLEQQGYNQHVKVTDEELHNVLKNAWNTNQFRQTPLDQKTIVKNILNNQDQMVIAATGGGKSLCYQLPAILLSQDYLPRITLVISPLIALMRDQVHALQQKGIFSSVSLDSMQNSHEQINYLTGIRRGDYSIIYASPERIRSDAFVRALQGRTIGLIAFDEAHCISEWGHDFRTDYLAISHWIDEKICKQERKFPIVALTATARKGYAAPQEEQKDRKQASYKAINKGTIEDIHEKLKLKCDLAKFVPPSPERKELEFHVIHIEHCPICDHKLEIRLGDVQCPMCKAHLVIDYKSIKKYIKEVKLRRLVDLLTGKDQPNLYQRWNKTNYKERQRGIIYCRTKKDIQKICEYLKELPELADLRTGAYHGSLDDEEKQETYEKFICDDQNGLDIIVATKAFGMGIDVRRLGFVIHFDIPSSPEAYYQEAGRAGRDDFFQEGRDRAQCILLYHEDDIQIQHYFLTKNTIDNDHIETLYNVLNQHRTNGQQEILVTANELALPAGLQEEEVNSILYYLEYQTKAGIHRTSITTNGWQLQFEVDYRQHLASLIEPEQQLLTCFQQDPDFQLNENMTTIIQARELAEKLGWQIADVKRRKKQLIHKGIIAQSSHVNIYWKQDQQDSRENLTSLFEALENICNLQQWDDKGNINQAHTITEKHIADTLKSSHPQVKISQFKKLLTLCSQKKEEEWQLFENFAKIIKRNQYETYTVQEKAPYQTKRQSKKIQAYLTSIIDTYAPKNFQQDLWQYYNLLQEKEDHEERKRLIQALFWLQKLELIDMTELEEGRKDYAMTISFEKELIPSEQLEINLTSLRQRRKQQIRMLEIMQEYATCPEEWRVQMLNNYFLGKAPLLEAYQIPQELTKEQREIVQQTTGYHLITGPAGSGKTTVLQEHVKYLVEAELVPVENILVATFFRSASEHIDRTLLDIHTSKQRFDVTTLNAFCEKLISKNWSFLKRANGANWFRGMKQLQLFKENWDREDSESQIRLSKVLKSTPAEQTYHEYWLDDFKPYNRHLLKIETCIKVIKRLRQQGIFPSAEVTLSDIEKHFYYLENNKSKCTPAEIKGYYCIYVLYLHTLAEEGKYTYDDQILLTLKLLQDDPSMARHYQKRFEHVIIDEAQDFTPAEMQLIKILSKQNKNMLIFGDDYQNIRPKNVKHTNLKTQMEYWMKCKQKQYEKYSSNWVPNNLEFVEEISTHQQQNIAVHGLTTNFRSMQEIVKMATIIRADILNCNPETIQQTAHKGTRGEKIEAIYFPTINYNTDTVIHSMVNKALAIIDKKLPMEDKNSVALLVAKQDMLMCVTQYLEDEKIKRPFVLLSPKRKYQTRLAHLVLTYLRLILNPRDNEATKTLLQFCCPSDRVQEVANHLIIKAKTDRKPLIEILSNRHIIHKYGVSDVHYAILHKHIALIKQFTSIKEKSQFKEVWHAISALPESPIPNENKQPEEYKELIDIFKQFHSHTVQGTIDYIDRHISFIDESHTYSDVIVTTIDYAKSQAFDTVFLLGAHELKHQQRWYVSVTRAKRRFFILMAKEEDKWPDLFKDHIDEYDLKKSH